MKVFPFRDEKPNPSYYRESILCSMDHPNIIKVFQKVDRQKVNKSGQQQSASYILMEYSPFPDFSSIIKHVDMAFNEKLCRTFFK